MLEITRVIETLLKKNGLHKNSLSEVEKLILRSDIPDNLASFHQKILDYLLKETSVIQDDTSLLATSVFLYLRLRCVAQLLLNRSLVHITGLTIRHQI